MEIPGNISANLQLQLSSVLDSATQGTQQFVNTKGIASVDNMLEAFSSEPASNLNFNSNELPPIQEAGAYSDPASASTTLSTDVASCVTDPNFDTSDGLMDCVNTFFGGAGITETLTGNHGLLNDVVGPWMSTKLNSQNLSDFDFSAPIKIQGDASSPNDPYYPGDPYNPSDPYHPGDPYNPGDPYSPQDPYAPTDPYVPSDPYQPQDPYLPGDPMQPGDPYLPGGSMLSSDRSQPSDPYIPTDPYSPGDPYHPTDPYSPSDPYIPNDPYMPGGDLSSLSFTGIDQTIQQLQQSDSNATTEPPDCFNLFMQQLQSLQEMEGSVKELASLADQVQRSMQ